MGATLDETRLELEAQRVRVRATADSLEDTTRRYLDIRAAIGRNPGRTIGLAAGAAFFLLGGPRRTVRFVHRTIRGPASGAKAYAGLPTSLRAFVDASAPGHGDAKARAREDLALALHAWREDPKNRKRADRLVSETLTPPGPERAFWTMVELAGVTLAAIIARQVVGRQLAGGALRNMFGATPKPAATPSGQATASAETTGARRPIPSPAGPGAARTAPAAAPKAATAEGTGYTGWSGRQPSVAGPGREPSPPPAATGPGAR